MGKLSAAIPLIARTWTSDLKDRGIRVNVVSPGMPLTPAMQSYLHANDGIEAGFNNMTPFGRPGEVDEVATAVRFLASDERRFVAGEALFVDSGIMAV